LDVPGHIRALTWNLFHGQDGSRLGPTARSALLGRAVDDGRFVHMNRRWIGEMAALVRERAPTVAALQEVPPLAVAELGRLTTMRPAHSLMPPLVGTVGLRGRLAASNPDLWRTHEGAANVVLVADPWTIVPGGVWTARHNPPGFVAARVRRLGLPPREAVHWLLEPRRLVAVRIRHPSGRTLTVASVHCHNSLVWEVIAEEVRRVLPMVLERVPPDEPVLFAGDLNAAGPDHPALRALTSAGLRESTTAALDLDHIFHRGLDEVLPPSRLPRDARELTVPWRGETRRVLLSDHDPVEATYALTAGPDVGGC
jgi:endonuclease/exonuclease/phosphatase family metal-dependent hydrolase